MCETELSPSGPLWLIVDTQQTMQVYRNGILIGRSKRRARARRSRHARWRLQHPEKKAGAYYSKKYDNGARCRNMQRLTWKAKLQALGNIPGYPARPRSIRCPRFLAVDFSATSRA